MMTLVSGLVTESLGASVLGYWGRAEQTGQAEGGDAPTVATAYCAAA